MVLKVCLLSQELFFSETFINKTVIFFVVFLPLLTISIIFLGFSEFIFLYILKTNFFYIQLMISFIVMNIFYYYALIFYLCIFIPPNVVSIECVELLISNSRVSLL